MTCLLSGSFISTQHDKSFAKTVKMYVCLWVPVHRKGLHQTVSSGCLQMVNRQQRAIFLGCAVFQVSLHWICITFVIRKRVIKRIFTCRNKNASKTILKTWGILKVYLGPGLAPLLTVGLVCPETSSALGRVFTLCLFSPAGLSSSSQKPKMCLSF